MIESVVSKKYHTDCSQNSYEEYTNWDVWYHCEIMRIIYKVYSVKIWMDLNEL